MFYIFRFAKVVIATAVLLVALAQTGLLPEATRFMAERAKEAFQTGTISYGKFNEKLINGK